MFDIGGSELIVIGVVALIVIGPKDLPEMFRTMGRFTAKARSMAREFQRAMESAADETGVKDVARDLRAVTSPKSMGLEAVKDAAAKFESWDPLKKKPETPAAKPAEPAQPFGAATQALADAQAEKRAALAEKAAAKKALAAELAADADLIAEAKPAARKRAPAKPKPVDAAAAAKRAPRKAAAKKDEA